MLTAGFEPAIPASERSQTHALDRAATGRLNLEYNNKFGSFIYKKIISLYANSVWTQTEFGDQRVTEFTVY